MRELKNDKFIKYIVSWKSNGLYNSKRIALHGAFLPNVKYLGNKIRMKFNSTLLVMEQNNKEKYVYADTELHLMEKVSEFLAITMLKML